MSSIRTECVALDTNVYALGIRRSPQYPACIELLSEYVPRLCLFLPGEVIAEINRNMLTAEQHAVYEIINSAHRLVRHFQPTDHLIEHFKNLGAKKGDAVISSQIYAAGIRWLISENRHFLSEIADLPFTVMTAAEALAILRSEE